MNLIKLTLTSFLLTTLIACGGGSPDKDTSDDVSDGTTEDIVDQVTVGTPNLGNGSAATFVSGKLALELSTIAAGATTNITASVVDITKENELITSKSYAVEFNSRCAGREPAQATFSAQDNTVITNSGDIVISYTAAGCTGVDQITAKLYEVTDGAADTTTVLANAIGEINVETADFGAISFESNSAEALTFTGIANSTLKSFSVVTFKVTDSFGNPIEGAEVNFTLSSHGAKPTASLAIDSGKTNSAGEVTTTVNAGTSHEVLSVIAKTVVVPDETKPSETVTKVTSSLPISVSTGIAVQSNFSLSADKFSVDAYAVDGNTVTITARLGDRYGNPVPEGTVVNFTAESGSIPSFCVVSSDGACSVDWTSQGTRPGDFHENFANTKNVEYLPNEPVTNPPTYSLQAVKGFTTITAYAMGEAGFVDSNSNGVYDLGEKFETYPEVFRNDNGRFIIGADNKTHEAYDEGEEFFEYVQDGVYTPAPTNQYQGPLCSIEAASASPAHCESNMYVTQSIRIVQSNGQSPYMARFYKKDNDTGEFIQMVEPVPATVPPTPLPANVTDAPFDVSADGKVYLLVTDTNGNIPAADVEISFAAENYKAIDSRKVKAREIPYIVYRDDFPGVVNFPVSRGLLHSFTIRPDTGAAATELEVTIPGGEGKAILNITP